MDAQTILKMIEEVQPDDTAKLDEIDFEAWLFIGKPDCGVLKFTRSRDALKAIRPEGYMSWAFLSGSKWCEGIYGRCAIPGRKNYEGFGTEEPLPTEELAELHAILQAIEYDRTTTRTEG